ncbi:MAG: FG-GAP repeat domain-containing protein, partial [Verrucomicrobiota bacterium]
MVRRVVVRLCLWLCAALPGWAASVPGWEEGPGHRHRPVQPAPATRVGFTAMPGEAAGLLFTNRLTGDAYLTNAVAHNGAGVAIGDIDADGWPDVYLCSLEGPNRLYRNLGGWKFAEIPAGEAACATQFSTG